MWSGKGVQLCAQGRRAAEVSVRETSIRARDLSRAVNASIGGGFSNCNMPFHPLQQRAMLYSRFDTGNAATLQSNLLPTRGRAASFLSDPLTFWRCSSGG